MSRGSRRGGLLLLAALGSAAIVHAPVLHNYFAYDDFAHLYDIRTRGFLAFCLEPFGGHLCVVPNAVSWLLYQLFGAHPEPYFALALTTHVANVGLLFRLVRRLTGRDVLSAFGAALWGTAPGHTGSLGWYSVYGHVLATTGLLVALSIVRDSVERHGALVPRAALACAVVLVAAGACFGTGLAAAVAFPFALTLALRREERGRGALLVVWSVPVVLGLAYVALYPHGPPLSMSGPAMVAPPLDPVAIGALWLHLLAVGVTTLTVAGLYAPVTYPGLLPTLAAVAVAAVLLAVAVRADPRRRRLLAACTLLVGAPYAAIAVARAGILSQLKFGLAASAGTIRYHYLATVPLTVLICLLLEAMASRVSRRIALSLVGIWAVSAGALRIAYPGPVERCDRCREETERVLETIHREVATRPPGSAVCIPNRGFVSVGLVGPEGFPGWAAVFVVFFPDDVVDGRRVYFVARNARVLAAARTRPHISAVLVGEPCPPA